MSCTGVYHSLSALSVSAGHLGSPFWGRVLQAFFLYQDISTVAQVTNFAILLAFSGVNAAAIKLFQFK